MRKILISGSVIIALGVAGCGAAPKEVDKGFKPAKEAVFGETEGTKTERPFKLTDSKEARKVMTWKELDEFLFGEYEASYILDSYHDLFENIEKTLSNTALLDAETKAHVQAMLSEITTIQGIYKVENIKAKLQPMYELYLNNENYMHLWSK